MYTFVLNVYNVLYNCAFAQGFHLPVPCVSALLFLRLHRVHTILSHRKSILRCGAPWRSFNVGLLMTSTEFNESEVAIPLDHDLVVRRRGSIGRLSLQLGARRATRHIGSVTWIGMHILYYTLRHAYRPILHAYRDHSDFDRVTPIVED